MEALCARMIDLGGVVARRVLGHWHTMSAL
jgi:hypothetical protein